MTIPVNYRPDLLYKRIELSGRILLGYFGHDNQDMLFWWTVLEEILKVTEFQYFKSPLNPEKFISI